MDGLLNKSKELILVPAVIASAGILAKRELPGLIVAIVIALLLLYVFRDEPAPTSRHDDALVSPVSGYVAGIDVTPTATRVDIDQRLTDVHTHYNPGTCYVKNAKWYDGTIYWGGNDVSRVGYYEMNCVNKIPFTLRTYPSLAGRFKSNVTKHTSVDQLEDIGHTEFGGRVSIFVPNTSKIMVNPGDTVQGGKTVLVRE